MVKATKGSVSQWINDDVEPSSKYVPALCRVLNVSIDELLGGKFRPQQVQEPEAGYEVFEREMFELNKVPVISWVPAGKWSDPADPYPPGAAEKWILCPFEFSRHSFCLKVVGDSMFPEYREGEYILVDPEVTPTHNCDVVARTPENTYTFKRLQITPEGTFLLALNPDHPERKIRIPEGTHICGVVTGSWQRRRRG